MFDIYLPSLKTVNSLLHPLKKKKIQVIPPQKTFVPLLSSTCVDLYVYNFNDFILLVS